MISDLINEHGSSTILKERLQLISDKYDLLAEKNQQLTEINSDLESKLKAALEDINKLKITLETYESSQSELLLKNETKNILKLLFKHEELDPREIVSHLSMEEGIVDYHLDILKEKEFARVGSVTMGSDLTGSRGRINWVITPTGRKYVVEVLGV